MLKKIVITISILYIFTLSANEVLLVGIAGGTGAGKTTIAKKIYDEFKDQALIISQDNYYKDLSHLSLENKATKINFDHPDSIDFELLIKDLVDLKNNRAIEIPIYDFCTHSRIAQKEHLLPQKVVILEGILLFCIPELRDILDVKIFVDTDDDLRLLRRIIRDVNERGRDIESIHNQYLDSVYPMYWEFVYLSKRYADFIIPGSKDNQIALKIVIDYLKYHLSISQ